MSYKLYYSPGSASHVVHWMLIELGVPHELVRVDIEAGANRGPSYLRLNPAGRVPTMIVDGVARTESAALLMLLAERHPEHMLAPLPGSTDRAEWLETMLFLANSGLPAMRDWFYADKEGEPAHADGIRRLAQRRIEAVLERMDRKLGDRAWLVGDSLTTADLLGTMIMRWSRNMPRPATEWVNLAPYVTKMRSRPSFTALYAREGLADWLNPD